MNLALGPTSQLEKISQLFFDQPQVPLIFKAHLHMKCHNLILLCKLKKKVNNVGRSPFFQDTYNLANVLWSYKNCIENDTLISSSKLHFNDFIMEWVGLMQQLNELKTSRRRTVFENHRKSLIQHCELHLHFEWKKVN